jgi:hypothetical protein
MKQLCSLRIILEACHSDYRVYKLSCQKRRGITDAALFRVLCNLLCSRHGRECGKSSRRCGALIRIRYDASYSRHCPSNAYGPAMSVITVLLHSTELSSMATHPAETPIPSPAPITETSTAPLIPTSSTAPPAVPVNVNRESIPDPEREDASHEEHQYLDLIREILKTGEHRPDRYCSSFETRILLS